MWKLSDDSVFFTVLYTLVVENKKKNGSFNHRRYAKHKWNVKTFNFYNDYKCYEGTLCTNVSSLSNHYTQSWMVTNVIYFNVLQLLYVQPLLTHVNHDINCPKDPRYEKSTPCKKISIGLAALFFSDCIKKIIKHPNLFLSSIPVFNMFLYLCILNTCF